MANGQMGDFGQAVTAASDLLSGIAEALGQVSPDAQQRMAALVEQFQALMSEVAGGEGQAPAAQGEVPAEVGAAQAQPLPQG